MRERFWGLRCIAQRLGLDLCRNPCFFQYVVFLCEKGRTGAHSHLDGAVGMEAWIPWETTGRWDRSRVKAMLLHSARPAATSILSFWDAKLWVRPDMRSGPRPNDF